MSLSRLIVGAAAAAFISAAIPFAAQAQSGGWKTSCNDGSTTMATGANACDGHGGIHKVHTVIQHRAPKATQAGVTQAGTPKPTETKPRYEERRGWRWGRHEERRREERREEKHRIVRCRDGRTEKVVGKGHEVCKHHGGIAH